jgi:hypothetical protein
MDLESGNPTESNTLEDDGFAGAPITPRGVHGELEGDKQEIIAAREAPEDQWFAVVPVERVLFQNQYGPKPKYDPILRPIKGCQYVAFPSRTIAREVCTGIHITESKEEERIGEGLCTIDQAVNIYGPFESEDHVAQRLWERDLATPCDTYKWTERTVRKRYYPRGHPRQGQCAGEEKAWALFHMDYGFQSTYNNIDKNLPEYHVPGSLLTSYLNDDGTLVHHNVDVIKRTSFTEESDIPEVQDLNRRMRSHHKNRLDNYVDTIFKRYIHMFMKFDRMVAHEVRWSIFDQGSRNVLLEGVNQAPPKMLGREFAKVLRTTLNSFYGRAQSIEFLIGDVHFTVDLTLVGEEYEQEKFMN